MYIIDLGAHLRATDETKRKAWDIGRALRAENIPLEQVDTSRLIPAEAWALINGYDPYNRNR